jgi:hypothetical protein
MSSHHFSAAFAHAKYSSSCVAGFARSLLTIYVCRALDISALITQRCRFNDDLISDVLCMVHQFDASLHALDQGRIPMSS